MSLIQIKDLVENAMKELCIGSYFAETYNKSSSEQNVDNNISARQAAQIAGFTLQHHTVACASCVDEKPHERSQLHLEERGRFLPFFI